MMEGISRFRRSTVYVDKCLKWPPGKTLCQKLIKMYILLSQVKLNKMSMVTRPSEQNKLSKKYMEKNQA
jgi:hypothetical protein